MPSGSGASNEVVDFAPGEIDVGERLRPVDSHWAGALGRIMARDGQLTPIEVCRLPGRKRPLLVTGGHRLAGAIEVGLPVIRALVVGADAAERRLREVSENLWRRELGPLDRSAFVSELVELERVRSGMAGVSPKAAAASVRWQKELRNEAVDANDIVSSAYGWTADVAARIGLNVRTVQRDLLLHRRLDPTAIGLLREHDHPAATNAGQLRALAALERDEQRLIVGMLLEGAARTVAEAQAVRRQKPRPSAEAKRLSAVIGNLARMGRAERQAAIEEIFASYPHEARAAHRKRNADQLASIGLERPSC